MSLEKIEVFRRYLGCVVIVALVIGTPAMAGAVEPVVTLTMDDLDRQPIDGLVHPSGVTFGFTVDSLGSEEAEYNSEGPGTTMFVDDPSIEGTTAGVMRFDFDSPSSVLEFGVAISTIDSLEDAIEISLFAPNNLGLISSSMLNLNAEDIPGEVTFAEAKFEHAGELVQYATVDFTSASSAAPRFALDNLTFSLVPEPSALLMTVLASVSIFCRRRHR